MKQVTMLDLRENAAEIIREVESGKTLLLTYRGRPVVRLAPVRERASEEDPFFAITGLATEKGASLTNEEMDRIIYGK
jgi:prevent-host-death family protein